jgi:hypothetical protein
MMALQHISPCTLVSYNVGTNNEQYLEPFINLRSVMFRLVAIFRDREDTRGGDTQTRYLKIK